VATLELIPRFLWFEVTRPNGWVFFAKIRYEVDDATIPMPHLPAVAMPATSPLPAIPATGTIPVHPPPVTGTVPVWPSHPPPAPLPRLTVQPSPSPTRPPTLPPSTQPSAELLQPPSSFSAGPSTSRIGLPILLFLSLLTSRKPKIKSGISINMANNSLHILSC
jgi:hypothetical protein